MIINLIDCFKFDFSANISLNTSRKAMSTSMAGNSNTGSGKTPKKGLENRNTTKKTPSKGSKKSPSNFINPMIDLVFFRNQCFLKLTSNFQ